MSLVTAASRKLKHSAERARGFRALAAAPHPLAPVIGDALRDARRGALDAAERAWVERIEHLRRDLEASTREVRRVDYGAGSPDVALGAEQMNTGVERVEPLGRICRTASKSPFWCCVLFRLVRALRPVSCVEMGTALGISAAYQAAALRLNGSGRLVTLEGAASLAEVAEKNLRALELDNAGVIVGRFHDTLDGALARMRPVDYVFVDGHHDHNATVDYFERIAPRLAERALAVFDDIAWSGGMRRAWRTLANDPRVALGVDLGAVGLCVVDADAGDRRVIRVPFA